MVIQDKDEVLAEIEQAEKAQQDQQNAMAQLQMQQLQVDNETKLAYAKSQDGLAQERIAKITTDKAEANERIRRSKEEESAAVLNFIRAIKELQGMDLTHLQQKIDLLHSLNPATNEQEKPKEAV